MKQEPTLIVELVRLLAILASTVGIAISAEEQAVIVVGLGALAGLVSVGLAIWNRMSVFSPKTTETLVAQAAVTGDPTVGDPPRGDG